MGRIIRPIGTNSATSRISNSAAESLIDKLRLSHAPWGKFLYNSPEGQEFIGNATHIARDTYATSSGHVYRLNEDPVTGNIYIERDEDLTQEHIIMALLEE